MNKLLKLIALVATMLPVMSDTVVYSLTATNTSESILTSPAVIRQITAVNARSSGDASTLKLFDTSSTNLTFSIGAYTNNVITTVSVVSTNTDILGNDLITTNSYIRVTPTLVSATTGNYRNVYTMVVPAGETLTYTPTTGIFLGNGLAATNINSGVTATIEYSKVR
jgi:hypothetical protein